MNQYPTLFLSLKDVDGTTFENAFNMLKFAISSLCSQNSYLETGENIRENEKDIFSRLRSQTASITDIKGSIVTIMNMMQSYYEKPVILLIDEYDVPLDKAFQYGYYDEMVSLLRNMFGNALKTNPNLYFAVLTGCLRISKESIFTGLNNLKVLTLTDVRFDEYFGFTDTEVKGMLEYYGLSGHYAEVKEWYDGYRFGNVEVYCPWDVINYCDLLRADPNALPQDYWSNTSGNAMVRRFIDKADTQTRDEIERLIAGDEILKEIHQELTYNELDSSIEVMLG